MTTVSSDTVLTDVDSTAVVSLDLQAGVVGVYAKDPLLTRRAAAIMTAARDAGVPVIHVRVAFRPGVPEASPRNAFLSAVKSSAPHQKFFDGESGAIHRDVAPIDGDLVVTKSRVGAFVGSDLDLLLRAADRTTLILFGIATGGAVLSTALHAADLDYRVVVVRDCCADNDESLHASLLDRLVPRYATVVSAELCERALRTHAGR